jgi:CheY-like chemotaxis protein
VNATKPLAGLTILLIDDEPDNLDVAMRLLRRAGAAQVLVAEHGAAGLAHLTAQPDLVLCDLSMPEMDGWEFMRQVRYHQHNLKLKVVALTAHAMTGDRERVLDVGFTGYISKPIDANTFVPQICQILSGEA